MIIAMMLPSSLPLIRLFHRLTYQRSDSLQLTFLLITGYLSIWIFFGVMFYLIDWVLHTVIQWLSQTRGWRPMLGSLDPVS